MIVNKKFWDGLPADIRTTLEGAMKDATKYANDIAKKENDDALEAVKKSGKTEIITLTPAEKAAWKKALVPVHKENESRVGKDIDRDGLQGNRLQALDGRVSTATPLPAARRSGVFRSSARAARASGRSAMLKFLDRLEEVADRVPDGGGDAAHLRRRRASLRRRLADSRRAGLRCSRSTCRGRRSFASTCSCGWRSSAPRTACAPASTSASTC